MNANFEKTLGNIKGFLEEKKRRGSRKPYVVFQVIEPFRMEFHLWMRS